MAKKGKPPLPDSAPGVSLVRTLEGHKGEVVSVAFDPSGRVVASGGDDHTVKLWDARTGALVRTLYGHPGRVWSVAFDSQGRTLATAGNDSFMALWNAHTGVLLGKFKGHDKEIASVAFGPSDRLLSVGKDMALRFWRRETQALLRTVEDAHSEKIWHVEFDPTGKTFATASMDRTAKVWSARDGELLFTLQGHDDFVYGVAFHPSGRTLVTASGDKTLKLWDAADGKLLRTLEGHTGRIDIVAFSPDGRLLASKCRDDTIRLWRCDTWETVAIVPAPTSSACIMTLAFHPTKPLLAAAGSREGAPQNERCRVIQLLALDYATLLAQHVRHRTDAVHHTTGKVVVVGDHSVGKSALGYRLIHGEFKEQASTHGQKFWVFPALGKQRADGTECEAILWDFAGQPDYRLVHALFVDNADLGLVLFDASNLSDPLHGVNFWLKQLQTARSNCPIILVAAQTDRGTSSLTTDELKAFCQAQGIVGPIATSALTGAGVGELIERMKSLIAWEQKAATVTTATFKRIKDYVLGLKGGQAIVTPDELRRALEATDSGWQFTDAEMLTAVGHLENYGYVKRLQTSKGESRILLQPERLNNLASSFVLEARRNPKGLGALEEKRLLAGGYDFPELKELSPSERDVLLDSAALLFLEHNVCFRETDPLRMEPYLVFPELINLKKPPDEEKATEGGVAYTVSGPTENVFASLVVLLGYTHTFTRTAQWQNNARYEVGDGLVCGFRQDAERDGELDFVLCFAPKVGLPVRALFQGLFESFLARRNLTIMRYEPVRCVQCGHLLERSVVRQRLKEGKSFAFCNDCGEKLTLPPVAEPIQLTKEVHAEVQSQRQAAEQRTHFEQAVFRVRAYVAEQGIKPPECFISYAWGVAEHERWVEKRLAADLQKAGIDILLDRWHNAQIGASVARFIEKIETSDRIVMIGTPLYRIKYENKDSAAGYVVAAEVDLIHNRLLGTEAQKASVLPLILDGDKTASLPPLLQGRVYADFRDEQGYFAAAFDLILSIYQLPPNHPAVADLRESLRAAEIRP